MAVLVMVGLGGLAYVLLERDTAPESYAGVTIPVPVEREQDPVPPPPRSPEPAPVEGGRIEGGMATASAATLPPPAPPVPAPAEPVVVRPPEAPAPVPPGAPLWQRNAVPFSQPLPRNAIAVVIDDLGVDRKRSNRVVRLPGPLTLAWMSYAADLPRQTQAARAAGHELMLHLPMEPHGGDADPGPGALLVSLGQGEQMRRLDKALASFDGYIGVNNHMGSRFTEDPAGMRLVLAELQRRGLMFLDSRTTNDSVAPQIARSLNLPNLGRDVFLDHEMTPAAVRASLARTEEVARRKGYAIAIGHPHDVTVNALAEWLPGLEARGYTLVPVSAILKARMAGG